MVVLDQHQQCVSRLDNRVWKTVQQHQVSRLHRTVSVDFNNINSWSKHLSQEKINMAHQFSDSLTSANLPGSATDMDLGSSARAKRKLGRNGSKSWFNKSFDQTVLNQTVTKPPHNAPIRRQSSVTDLFQNMLTRGKTHLQDIFSGKREKSKMKVKKSLSPSRAVQPAGAEGGLSVSYDERNRTRNLSSLEVLNNVQDMSADCSPSHSSISDINYISLQPRPNRNSFEDLARRSTPSPAHSAKMMDMFVVSQPKSFRSHSEEIDTGPGSLHRAIIKKSSLQFSPSFPVDGPKISSDATSGNWMKSPHATSLSPNRAKPPHIVTSSLSNDSTESLEDGRVSRCSASSAPEGKRHGSISISTTHLSTDHELTITKRALVKSNSDTFTRAKASPQTLSKASSDGNCFKKSPTSSLASSLSSLDSVMVSITDYLYMGSIEAAYNEPLLCKYGITSLIDITNISPAVVPNHKKSDCPCACVNNTHFRSKLNIGVDDIEWENLEQYFEEINAFIHGARKKGKRVLVYSYMGLSRAPAAVIQHLMIYFKMPYRDALNIVRSKRPQVKLNSGFVKALHRLQKNLGLGEKVSSDDKQENGNHLSKPDESPKVSHGGSVENVTAPPVVRGAWLEC